MFLLRTLGKIVLGAAMLGLLTSVSLFLMGTYLLTFPILRQSSKAKKLQATVNLASALVTTLAVYESDLEAAKVVRPTPPNTAQQ